MGEDCAHFYPYASKKAGEEGSVTLLVQISPDGWARDVKIETSSGYPRLDTAAISCIKSKPYFEPEQVDGVKVVAWQRMKWTWRSTN